MPRNWLPFCGGETHRVHLPRARVFGGAEDVLTKQDHAGKDVLTTSFDFPGDSRDFPVGTSLSSTQIISKVAPNTTGTTRNSTKEARPLTPQAGRATTATARTGDGTTTRSTRPTTKKRTETPKRLRI